MNLGKVGGEDIKEVLWDSGKDYLIVMVVDAHNPFNVCRSKGRAEDIITGKTYSYYPPVKSLESRMIDKFKEYIEGPVAIKTLGLAFAEKATSDTDYLSDAGAFYAGFMAGKGDKE